MRRWLFVVAAVCLLAAAAATAWRLGTHNRKAARAARTVMSREEQLRAYQFAHLQPVVLKNCELKRFGEANDGGYLLCANLLGGVTSAYSYGISGYDGWGCDVSQATRVAVHEYDCFNLTRPACSAGQLVFHPECVGPRTERIDGRPFDSIAQQLTRNGDGTGHVVMKMDVEGAEWDSLLETPAPVLEQIDQLAIEFHGVGEEKFILTLLRLKDFFHLVHLHFNNFACQSDIAPFPARAYEVLFVSKRLGMVDAGAVARLPHPLDAPNAPQLQDCQASR